MKSIKSYIKKPRATPHTSWTIPNLCRAYDWPTNAPGGGVIAIVELGGGWKQLDVDLAFTAMNLPVPIITDVSVDGTTNTPGSDADMEVALDIQVAGGAYAMATGKAATIRVYWSQDIGKAVKAAMNDGCDVCSISWGAPEEEWGKTAVTEMNKIAKAATTKKGMAIFAAAGDNDSDDGAKAPSVDCPACCPYVVGCGGTSLSVGGIETVWNNNPGHANGEGTGGGYSFYFPKESWQLKAPAPPTSTMGRMVPDVAANADPQNGYTIVLDASAQIVGGTSAVAPLYAGLVAATFGAKPGWITPEFYKNASWFNDITSGNNGTYAARIGPDPCTGMGSPKAGSFKR